MGWEKESEKKQEEEKESGVGRAAANSLILPGSSFTRGTGNKLKLGGSFSAAKEETKEHKRTPADLLKKDNLTASTTDSKKKGVVFRDETNKRLSIVSQTYSYPKIRKRRPTRGGGCCAAIARMCGI